MTSSNGNIFRVTGHLCVEFTVPCEFPAQRPVTRNFHVFFDLRLNKWLSKQSRGWWFETQSCPLWRHCNELYVSMMMWSNGSIFRPLCGEFTGHQWIPLTKANFDIFFDQCLKNGWVNNRDAGNLRRHHAHSGITVMSKGTKGFYSISGMCFIWPHICLKRNRHIHFHKNVVPHNRLPYLWNVIFALKRSHVFFSISPKA